MWDTASFQQIPPKLHSVKKQVNSQWEFAIWLKEFKLGLYNNLEGWEWARGGREIQEVGDICTPIVNSCWCMTNQNIFWWLCIVNKAEIDIFLELCFFHDPMMLAIWSLVPLPFLKHKLESRFPGEILITSDMQMTPPLWQKVKRN